MGLVASKLCTAFDRGRRSQTGGGESNAPGISGILAGTIHTLDVRFSAYG